MKPAIRMTRRATEDDLALIFTHSRRYRKLSHAVQFVISKAAEQIRRETAAKGKGVVR
jgi:hypothetical protein